MNDQRERFVKLLDVALTRADRYGVGLTGTSRAAVLQAYDEAAEREAELVKDAERYRWLRKLKSGRPESQIALARVILALREKPEAMDVFIDEQIATDRAALAPGKER